MISDDWRYHIEHRMPFAPTAGQREAIGVVSQFLASPASCVMILRGYAGTGKTSVARAVVSALRSLRRKTVLLAPTGRAAKVLQSGTGEAAHTIHRKIYRQQSYMSTNFSLNDNLHSDTLFIVDEASMISRFSDRQGAGGFGSGSLLDDLMNYVSHGTRCGLMLIGDTAQLPPVGSESSPALSADIIRGYGTAVYEYDMREVLRQSQSSGILFNATMLRELIVRDDTSRLPRISLNGFADISVCEGSDLVETLASAYSRSGQDETIVITRSNKRANVYNLGIRSQVLWREEELTSGDQLMIVKNNYFWVNDKAGGRASDDISPAFLANGDRCVVRRVRSLHEVYGFRFADVSLLFPDYDDYELDATVLLDTLQSESPSLTAAQQEMLFNRVMEDYADVRLKAERLKLLRADKFFNALQVKYAYAVTCHKAQGGQWSEVFLDQGYVTEEMLSASYIRWLYTAFTRATRHLHLVNWRKEQTADPEE